MKATEEISPLLQKWRSQRAARVNFSVARLGIVLTLISIVTDILFNRNILTLSGAILSFLGCIVTYISARKEEHPQWIWMPLYFGFWYAASTSLADTGGIGSPFIGSFLALLFVGGLVIQTVVRPVFLTLFVFLNLSFWIAADFFLTNSFGAAPVPLYSFIINGVVLFALMLCIHEFLQTEKTLAGEILEHYKDLSKAREILNREESANATKSTFLANISHELRTPLGAILGYAELASDPDLDEIDRTDFMATVIKNGNQLLHLVNDLLDLTKVEAGKIEIEKVYFDPLEIINEVIDLLNLTAEKKGLKVDLILADQKLLPLLSDPLRFRQILMNIVSNAVKFSQRGFIFIILRYPKPAEKHPQKLVIEIQDSGPGLTLEEQERLFKPFSQADGSVARKYGGSGLGLNLSRQLARLLGGDLSLEWTQPGVGSRFVLHLPAPTKNDSVSTLLTRQITPRNHLVSLIGKTILIVEDNLDNQKLISTYLKCSGADLEIARDGLEAIAKVSDINYDLIIMDVQMPIMDGLQATALLRQKKFTNPILALTAHAMKEDRDRCIAAGFDDYLTKPIDKNLLLEKVGQYLN